MFLYKLQLHLEYHMEFLFPTEKESNKAGKGAEQDNRSDQGG